MEKVLCHEMVHAEFMRSLMELQRPDDTAFAAGWLAAARKTDRRFHVP